MSVMVFDDVYFKRVGKFMKLRTNEQVVLERLNSWHELNIRNYCKRYEEHGERFEGLSFNAGDFNYSDIPIPSAVQVVSDLKGLLYNCSDYGKDIDNKAFEGLNDFLDYVMSLSEYESTKLFIDDVAY